MKRLFTSCLLTALFFSAQSVTAAGNLVHFVFMPAGGVSIPVKPADDVPANVIAPAGMMNVNADILFSELMGMRIGVAYDFDSISWSVASVQKTTYLHQAVIGGYFLMTPVKDFQAGIGLGMKLGVARNVDIGGVFTTGDTAKQSVLFTKLFCGYTFWVADNIGIMLEAYGGYGYSYFDFSQRAYAGGGAGLVIKVGDRD
ncbi:MAG: hypothetical protein HZC28_08915 [Spirochaetes bacterium]|nr:hypothetical protein [Spirochaetota bacterium]